MSSAYPQQAERLICVTATPGMTAACECGRPLFTPQVEGALVGALTVDWVRCSKCQAHVVVRIEASPPAPPPSAIC